MTTPKSIFHQAQEQVCDTLNNDSVLSGKVTFISENSKDIDYEIKNALGRQGIVGVVMTPDATYQGVTDNGEQVWDLHDFTVQVVENPMVNRGQPNYSNITAHDAVTRAVDVLNGTGNGLFGQYCPTTIEQGEDSGLIVAQARFNVQIRGDNGDEPSIPTRQGVTFKDGNTVPLANYFFESWDFSLTRNLTNSMGYRLSDVDEVAVMDSHIIDNGSRELVNQARKVWISGRMTVITPSNLFSDAPQLEEVIFLDRTMDEVQSINGYPWGIDDTGKIKVL